MQNVGLNFINILRQQRVMSILYALLHEYWSSFAIYLRAKDVLDVFRCFQVSNRVLQTFNMDSKIQLKGTIDYKWK